MTENAITKQQEISSTIEQVVIGGDLSKLTPGQRVNYYKSVCESIGLNPLTRPFDYITLNNRLTLYARKDATDQLRSIHGVSIDDVDIQETDGQYIVKVKGHNRDGRTDVEIGVVNKTDMRGDLANAQMKAVTKGKRRLTLSLCGLGLLDETEIQSIPDAGPVTVTDDGEIIEDPEPVKAPELSYEKASKVANRDDVLYIDIDEVTLGHMANSIKKALRKNGLSQEERDELTYKLSAIQAIKKHNEVAK